MSFFSFRIHQNTPKLMSAGASPQTPLGELTALSQTPSRFQGGRFVAGGNGGKGMGKEGKRGE